jgi:hypothetical protein
LRDRGSSFSAVEFVLSSAFVAPAHARRAAKRPALFVAGLQRTSKSGEIRREPYRLSLRSKTLVAILTTFPKDVFELVEYTGAFSLEDGIKTNKTAQPHRLRRHASPLQQDAGSMRVIPMATISHFPIFMTPRTSK